MKNKKAFIRGLIALCVAMTALIFAAINLHVSLNMLGKTDEDE